MLALENDSGDRQRWMQKGVSHQPAERDVNDLSCVSELPDAVGSYAEYVPPEGFDCEPVGPRSGHMAKVLSAVPNGSFTSQ